MTNNHKVKLMKLTTCCFSPTGTSRKNMQAVVEGLKMDDVQHLDYTYNNTPQSQSFASTDLVLFSAPVYGGKVPPTALQRMEQVRGEDTPAILLVTYGNRNFEQALVHLADFVRERGFRPIAAAALIGEHSYSHAQYPIAVGRPDAADLASAEEFGRRVVAKLQQTDEQAWDIDLARDMPHLETPEASLQAFRLFVQEYTRQQQENPVKVFPAALPGACSHCGVCVDLCPVQAIAVGGEEVSDASRCIRCCACVKGCPTGARTFNSPFAKPLSENFQMRREPLYLL